MADNQGTKITRWQWFTVVSSIIISVQIIVIPRLVAETAEQDAWIAMLIAGLITLLGGLAYLYMSLRFPDMNLYQYSQVIMGKYLGGLFILVFLIFMILSTGLATRMFADSIIGFLLPNTPVVVIILTFLLTTMYLVNRGLLTMVKVIELIFPIMLVSMILVTFLPLRQANWGYLLPILPEGPSRLVKALPTALQAYFSFGIIGFMVPLSENKKLMLPLIGGVSLAIFMQTMLTITIITFFGIPELRHILYPLIAIAKGLEFPGSFLQRAETFFMLAWIPITFTRITTHFYMANAAVAHFFPKIKWPWISWFIFVLVLPVSLFPASVPDNLTYALYTRQAGTILAFGFLPFLFSIALLRKVKKK